MTGRENDYEQDYPTEFLTRIFADPCCDRCKDPERKLHRAGLCLTCYRAKRKVIQLQSRLEKLKKSGKSVPFDLQFEFRVRKQVARLCQVEGAAFGGIDKKDITGLDVEHLLSALSERVIKKDVFFGEANLFDWSFSPSQKRLLFYLISKLERALRRRNRLNEARWSVAGNRDEIEH